MQGKLLLTVMLLCTGTGSASASPVTKPDPPYEPSRGYVEQTFVQTDIPVWVTAATRNLVTAEYELGTTIDDQLFLGEIPGGAVYGYKQKQYEAAEAFIAATDFSRQGIMGVGTSSTHHYDPKITYRATDDTSVTHRKRSDEANRVMTFFYNVLLGPGRAGGINGQLDYRLKACATPITGWRQGVLLIRVNRVLKDSPDQPDHRPVMATFTMFDLGTDVRPFTGASIRRAGGFTFGSPIIGIVAFKVRRTTTYTFRFNAKERTVDVISEPQDRRVAIGAYAYMGETMQPTSHGLYAAGLQIGDRGLFGRLGYINMNRFNRGTDVPDRLARGPNASIGYSFSPSRHLALDICADFGPTYVSSVEHPRGNWFGSPGVTATLGYNF